MEPRKLLLRGLELELCFAAFGVGVLLETFWVSFHQTTSLILTLLVFAVVLSLCSRGKAALASLAVAMVLFGAWRVQCTADAMDRFPWESVRESKLISFDFDVIGFAEEEGEHFRSRIRTCLIRLETKDHSSCWEGVLYSESKFDKGQSARAFGRFRKVENLGNFREFDREAFHRNRGNAFFVQVDADDFFLLDPENPFQEWSRTLRESVRKTVGRWMHPERGSLLLAMLLGEKRGVSTDLMENFRKLGLSHLFVVSGLHISLVFGFLLGMISLLGSFLPLFQEHTTWRIRSMTVAILCTVFLSRCINLPVSTWRALFFAGFVIFLLYVKRPHSILRVWLLVLFGVLLVFPGSAFDVSAQLSFGAVLGILWMNRWAQERRGSPKKFEPKLMQVGRICLGAWMYTAPFVLYHFGSIQPASFLINALMIPVFGVMGTVLGFLSLLISPVSMSVSGLLLCFLDEWFRTHLALVEMLSDGLEMFRVEWFITRTSFGAMLLILWILSLKPFRGRTICLLSLFFLIPIWEMSVNRPEEGVDFLAVGQGDAALIRKDGKRILVDAGSSYGRDLRGRYLSATLQELQRENLKRIDVLILTHDDHDHIGGSLSILRHFSVGEVWSTETPKPGYWMRRAKALAARRDIVWMEVDRSFDPLARGLSGLDILHPPVQLASRIPDNDRSVVVRVSWEEGLSFLFSGDIELKSERRLLASDLIEPTDVLKVSHHGSRTSTSDAFLEKLKPAFAVISSGKGNRFGHPHQSVMKRLYSRDISTFLTTTCGQVRFFHHEGKWRTETGLGCGNPL